jgi:hypothetical protein
MIIDQSNFTMALLILEQKHMENNFVYLSISVHL